MRCRLARYGGAWFCAQARKSGALAFRRAVYMVAKPKGRVFRPTGEPFPSGAKVEEDTNSCDLDGGSSDGRELLARIEY